MNWTLQFTSKRDDDEHPCTFHVWDSPRWQREERAGVFLHRCLLIWQMILWLIENLYDEVKNPIPPTRRPTRRPTRWSTHHRHVGWHAIFASADTSVVCRPRHYRRVGRHSIDALVEILSFSNYFISFSWRKQEQLH